MSDKLRVLIISHAHPSISLSGGEIASYNLHKGLNTIPDVQSVYLARAAHPIPRHGTTALMSMRRASDEILFHADEYDHFYLSNKNTDEIRRDLLRFVRDFDPDIVHFHHVLGLGLETLYAIREALPDRIILVTFHEFLSICNNDGQMVKAGTSKLCNEASPIDCHGCFPQIPPARFLKRERFVRGMLELADAFVSPSEFLANRYLEWGLNPDKMAVIENGIAIRDVTPPRELTGPNPRRSRFAFFGQINPFKGIDVLVDAVSRVPEQVWGEDSRLMIFGGNLEKQPPAFQERMQKLIEEAGPRVRFYGAYQNAEMPRLMQSVDWVVMPSIWWENSPIVIQEALHHRRPVICSNIGGMAEKIRDGEDGLHFRVRSAEDLADRFTEVLSEPSIWDRLHHSIRNPVHYVDCAKEHLDLYNRLRGSNPADRNRQLRKLLFLRQAEPGLTLVKQKEDRMARALVMIPAGEVYDHDNVRWYRHTDVQGSINHYHNIGDAFVFESSLKLMNYEKASELPITNFSPEKIDQLREEYDYVILRGSNYINKDMNWRDTIPVLQRLKLPVIAFGIGAQAPVRGEIQLSEETKAVLRIIADLTTSIGVRGAYTAQVLNDIGIRNVRIVGCPTAFRRNNQHLRIKLPPLENVTQVSVTVRREVSPAYAQDIEQYLTRHRDLIKTMAGRFDVTLMAQGEIDEKKMVFGTAEQKEEAIAALKNHRWTADWYFDEIIENLYRHRMFYSDVVADYEELVRRQQLVLGYRLHGNLMALANGVPSIYFTYDSRTAEFAETYKIPSYDVFSDKPFRLEDYWDQSLFDKYNRAWFETYAEMKQFLDENGVDNKMTETGLPIAELKVA